jgi:hypothetical protein
MRERELGWMVTQVKGRERPPGCHRRNRSLRHIFVDLPMDLQGRVAGMENGEEEKLRTVRIQQISEHECAQNPL